MEDQSAHLIYPPNVLHNTSINNAKFLISCFIGATSGILGLETLSGFSFFAVASAVAALLLGTLKCGGKPDKYFKGGWTELITPDFWTFILVWTLFCEFTCLKTMFYVKLMSLLDGIVHGMYDWFCL